MQRACTVESNALPTSEASNLGTFSLCSTQQTTPVCTAADELEHQPTREQVPEFLNFAEVDPYAVAFVNVFFEHIYPIPSFSFLHPGATKERLQEGSLDEALGYAVCGVAANLPTSDAISCERSLTWITKVEQIIWQQLERPSMARLQAIILCVAYRMETGAFQRAFMLAGLAARAATAMRLNHERQDMETVISETRRRTLWSLKILELYFSIGLPEYEILPFENVYLQLPIREDEFQQQSPSSHLELGSYSIFVKLTSIRRDIMKLNRSVALCDQPFPQLIKLIRSLERELCHLRTQMSVDANVSSSSVLDLMNTPWLARQLVMQLSWHQCLCDLYRLLLPGYPEAVPSVVLEGLEHNTTEKAIQSCLEHALAIIQILSEVNSRCMQTRFLEFDTAICGYHAARLVLFLSQSKLCGNQLSREYALSRAELCLAAIRRFFRSSALVNPILRDLERLIAVCASAPHDQSKMFPSSSTEDDVRGPQLPDAAKARQRLAIHSLLRQAEFEDDKHEDVTSPSSAGSALLSRRHRNMQRLLDLPTRAGTTGPWEDSNTPWLSGLGSGPEFASHLHVGAEMELPLSQTHLQAFASHPTLLPWFGDQIAFADESTSDR
ncbi:hypothetical protein LTR70_007466 [Exophiala xenobiotica]|uniref:Xylanolytic transcriptional activator regulatory domain-containing protein n=1 Tax=Lithohypha guttulata TaxID=1690604 RepID=A0ABR0KNN0_9EURO|nr:hypothetical protein LTR24_000387 [Lithohypha guttulata]KAK5313697.1 hypothetical protein LTR70_007466 [Exophiala xenobiotica]